MDQHCLKVFKDNIKTLKKGAVMEKCLKMVKTYFIIVFHIFLSAKS
jgi:hypothetical protein